MHSTLLYDDNISGQLHNSSYIRASLTHNHGTGADHSASNVHHRPSNRRACSQAKLLESAEAARKAQNHWLEGVEMEGENMPRGNAPTSSASRQRSVKVVRKSTQTSRDC